MDCLTMFQIVRPEETIGTQSLPWYVCANEKQIINKTSQLYRMLVMTDCSGEKIRW